MDGDSLNGMSSKCALSISTAQLEARAKCQDLSGKTASEFVPAADTCLPDLPTLNALMSAFHLSWSHYVRLMSVDKPIACFFYESEAIRGGWSVRQLFCYTRFYQTCPWIVVALPPQFACLIPCFRCRMSRQRREFCGR